MEILVSEYAYLRFTPIFLSLISRLFLFFRSKFSLRSFLLFISFFIFTVYTGSYLFSYLIYSALIVSLIMAIVAIGEYYYNAMKTDVVFTEFHYGSTNAAQLLAPSIFFLFLNIIIVFFRQSEKITRSDAEDSNRNALARIFFPKNRNARTARNFALLFYYGITRPLVNLLKGVRELNENNLDVKLEIQIKDEIGYLTKVLR